MTEQHKIKNYRKLFNNINIWYLWYIITIITYYNFAMFGIFVFYFISAVLVH